MDEANARGESRPTRRSMLRGALAAAVVAASGRVLARQAPASFRGQKAGVERNVDNLTCCWCPPGRFVMGSPPSEAYQAWPTVRSTSGRLGVPTAGRGAVGIRLPGRRRPRRSATRSAVRRPTSRGSPTTGPGRARRSAAPPGSAAIRPTPGGCTTCTPTRSSGAGIGTTRDCPEASIRTCVNSGGCQTGTGRTRASAAAAHGTMTGGRAVPPCACSSNPGGVTPTSASGLPPCNSREKRDGPDPDAQGVGSTMKRGGARPRG